MASLRSNLAPLFEHHGFTACDRALRWVKRSERIGTTVEAYRGVGQSMWTLGWGWWVIGCLPDELWCEPPKRCHALGRVAWFTDTEDFTWSGSFDSGHLRETAHGSPETSVPVHRIATLIDTAVLELTKVQDASSAREFLEMWWWSVFPWGRTALDEALASLPE